MTKRMHPRSRVTVSLPSDLVRRLDRQSREQGASRSGLAELWLRAGERQASLLSLEQELESYYSQQAGPQEGALSAALGRAARKTAAAGERRRRPHRRSAR
jgi:ribbon-helix-helix CopG family protein